MTDYEFVLEQLRAGPRDAMQIITASIRQRDVGLTVHSRVADLRTQGYTITCAVEGETRKGRPRWVYRLTNEPRSAGVVDPPAHVEPGPQPCPPAVARLDAKPEQLVLA